MEELRKLEQVQSVLTHMESRGFAASTDLDSNRFLANLVLLLVQPCGELGMNEKCGLISEFVPNISEAFLQEVSQWLGSQSAINTQGCGNDRGIEHNDDHGTKLDKGCGDSLQVEEKGVAMVGLDAMERANSTLEDFCRSYFMFHGMEVNQLETLFKYLPLLSFVESYIYQLDGLNEEILHISAGEFPAVERGFMELVDQGGSAQTSYTLKIDPLKLLVGLLKSRGLLTERIMEEFRCGEEYWALERKLCRAVISKEKISVEDAMRAVHLKSFDYRVLNLLLYQLRGEEVNDLHMEFLSISEFLVEISDDLQAGPSSSSYQFDYEDDVLENNFNILRMLVYIYGPSTAPAMLAKYISEAERRYDQLLKTLDPQLSLNYRRRCEEATKEGGKISGHTLGTWNIPPLILDEDSYRINCVSPK